LYPSPKLSTQFSVLPVNTEGLGLAVGLVLAVGPPPTPTLELISATPSG
jgi:hypothetical protein